jgi:hypothetical protein
VPEIFLQRLLATEKIHRHLPQVIDQKIGLGREMQLAPQVSPGVASRQ